MHFEKDVPNCVLWVLEIERRVVFNEDNSRGHDVTVVGMAEEIKPLADFTSN